MRSFSLTRFCLPRDDLSSARCSSLSLWHISARKSEAKFVVCYPKSNFFSPNFVLLQNERANARAHTKEDEDIVDSRRSGESSGIARRRRGTEVRDRTHHHQQKKKKNTKRMKKELSQSVVEKLVWIAIYSLCSSSMLVVNKLAVAAIPLPTVVSGAQLVSSALVPLLMQVCGAPVIGKMTTGRVAPYVVYTSMFAAGLFANMKALLLTNVGAVIAARCCLPLIVSVIEYVFMGRSWPNKRSMVSLVSF